MRRCVVGAIILLLALPVGAAGEASEFKVKAAYLYHLTQFTHWPASAFRAPDGAFRLCVLGEDPFGEDLLPLAQRQHDGHPITLAYPRSVNEARDCHLLYIATSESAREVAVLDGLRDTPVLTVSSSPEFIARGGIVGFVTVNHRVRLEINLAAARQARLGLSAKLLEVAMKVLSAAVREDGKWDS